MGVEPTLDENALNHVLAGSDDASFSFDGLDQDSWQSMGETSLQGHVALLSGVDAGGSSDAEKLQVRQDFTSSVGIPSTLAKGGVGDRIKSRHGGGGKEEASIASSDDFVMQVEYAPKQRGSGYLFRLQLIPKSSAVFRRIAHNVFFLIDRSHSIPTERYEAAKGAVGQALTMLQEGDTFNVLVFDKHVVQLAPKNLQWNEQNIERAYAFLSQQPHGGMFATTDLYASLGNIVPKAVAEKEVNTAILLSDGDTYLSMEKQQEAISQWTKQNQGKVSLYSVASGKGNNLPLLDILSSVNKGSLYYAYNDDQLPSALLTLTEAVQNPIGKEIVTSAIASNKKVKVTLYPSSQRLPNLYDHIPYVIYGSIDRLDDFHVFFQGKYYDKWLDIKQEVSFKTAKLSKDDDLEKMWALQQAYDEYSLYLNTGDKSRLHRARQILASYKIAAPF